MKRNGIVIKWNDERGFGFIRCDEGKTEYFFHVTSFHSRIRPSEGLKVNFDTAKDNQDRDQAVNIRPLHQQVPIFPIVVAFVVSSLFLLFVVDLWYLRAIPASILWLYLSASAISFVQYARDKSAAIDNRRRTPESRLHNMALIGGWPGALLAQQFFRHKSRKQPFRLIFWLTVTANISVLIFLVSPYGIKILRAINLAQVFLLQLLAP